MVAPLLFDGRLRGVVYRDSRVAKGMFTAEDVDILMAITNHVAVSLETARAAQLAVAVQAARRQRDVAEMLRESMSEQSATLNPDEVLRRLLRALTRTLHGDAAALLAHDGARYVLIDSHNVAVPPGTELAAEPALPTPAGLTGPLVRTVAPTAPVPFGGLFGSPRSWLAIPVAERRTPLGVLLVTSSGDDLTHDAQAEVAAALAGQGMTALENARLFAPVGGLA